MSDSYSNVGAGCLLVFAAFCVFILPIVGLAVLGDDSGSPDDAQESSDDGSDAVNNSRVAKSSWAIVIVPLACLGCVAVPIIAWLVIKPFD